MRILLVLILSILYLPFTNAQSFWADANPEALSVPESNKLAVYPTHYRTLELDLPGLQQSLAKAPMEYKAGARQQAVEIALPFPDGRMEVFHAVESPVMKPALAAKYPMIRTFSAFSGEGKPYSARFDYTVHGFHAVIRTDEGTIYIDPYAEGQTQYYISYYTSDVDLEDAGIPVLGCGWSPGEDEDEFHPEEAELGLRGPESVEQEQVNLRVYDMALACTGEYGQAKGGTLASVLSSFNTALNRVNEIVVPEANFKFELIGNNDQLIFLNPATDPYTNANVGLELLNQNTAVINSIVGAGSYDIGHVFTMGCTDVGGVAGGTVCSQGKARGVTCHYTGNVIAIAERVMAHELAHQFSASHTWSNCPGILDQLASDSAFEPGSGSTIMSYAGSCGSENVQFGSDNYYHVRSLVQMQFFTTAALGGECPDLVPVENYLPELDLPYEDGFFIPINTPFELNAIGSDIDGDALTFCWEQYDLGPLTTLGNPINDSPLFRSFPPTASSSRTFPRLPLILSNNSDLTELLPSYSRNLTFRCTVRDNYPGGGGTVWEEVKFKATEQAGPFLVTFPNAAGAELTGGTFETITWDVANTDQAPVNCQTVNIRLSTNGGQTFSILLAAGVPNTGSATIAIPDITANSARIRVEAADNIFFDLSNANFKIVAPAEPGFTIQVLDPVTQTVCIPAEAQVTFGSNSILGYDSLLTFEVWSGLPGNAGASFSAAEILPGESTTLNLDFNDLTGSDNLEIVVRATSTAGDTLFFPLFFQLIFNNFDALTMDTPANSASNLNLNEGVFSWTDPAQADTYDFQLATSPSFSEEFMVHEKYGLTETSYIPNTVLENNTLYFWRIRASNQCGSIDFLHPNAFHTVPLTCDRFESNEVPMGIPSTGTPTRTSEVTILQEGTINDLNVVDVKGYHEGLQQLRVSLQGPDGTQVKLFGEFCGSSTPFNLDLDDESPLTPPCPPNNGQAYQPAEPLSAFDGKNTAGTWKLVVQVVDDFGNGGLLENWGLEFCASFQPQNPYLVNNNLLQVQPAGVQFVLNSNLLVQDDDNTAEELTYTLVAPPQHGTLVWFENELEAGGQFRQISINAGNVWYVHSGDGSETDSFSFVVEDGTGGWLGITTFQIEVNPDAPIATRELPAVLPARLFPNPTTGLVRLELPETERGELLICVFNAQGQVALTLQQNAEEGIDLDLSALPPGMYGVSVIAEKGRYSGKVIKQ